MHQRVMIRRRADANAKISRAVGLLADRFQVQPPDFSAVGNVGGSEVIALKQSEILADYLIELVDALEPKRKGKQGGTSGAAKGDQAQDSQRQEEGGEPSSSTENVAGSDGAGGAESNDLSSPGEDQNEPAKAAAILPPPEV